MVAAARGFSRVAAAGATYSVVPVLFVCAFLKLLPIDEPDAQSVQELARQLDADPRIRALLARHRVSSIEYATAVYAALHAGMFLAMESLADKASRTSALASFTPEQRANIELLRRRPIK